MAVSDSLAKRRFGQMRRHRGGRGGVRRRLLPKSERKMAAPGGPKNQPSGVALSATGNTVGWDLDAFDEPSPAPATTGSSLAAQLLSLLSEPGITSITLARAAKVLHRPQQDVQNSLEALVSAGELVRSDPGSGPLTRYTVPQERKAKLEAMYIEAAHELGEGTALATVEHDDFEALVPHHEDDEPRLPVTAGLLSMFLPGTGQLLNGDVGRASLVFAVWSLALLTNLPPIWTFVCLYAGAEAFFSAKVRSMERQLALESASDDTQQTHTA